MPVAERRALRENRVGGLFGRHAFAGQGAFLRLEVHRRHQAQVGGHQVAGPEPHQVARHKLRRGHDRLFSAAHDARPRAGDAAQGLQRLFGPALLHHARDGVHHDDGEDDDGIDIIAVPLNPRRDKRNSRRNQQDNHHKIRKLGQKPLEEALLFRAGQLVRAAVAQPLCSLGGRQAALRVGAESFSAFFPRQALPFQIYHPPFFIHVYSQFAKNMV